MARLGTTFLRQFNFLTNKTLFVNRVQPDFSPLISTIKIKTDIVEKLKNLNVPMKPKKPGNPFILFLKEMQPRVTQENPTWKMTQTLTKCAELWKTLDSSEKGKFEHAFLELKEQYEKDILKFEAKLTPEQKKAHILYESAKKKDRENRKKKKEFAALQKPKKPKTAYLIYITELSKMRNQNIKDIMSEAGELWHNLTDTEKTVYHRKAKEEKEQHERELKTWEDKMKENGRLDLIRKVIVKKDPKQSRILKFRAPEDIPQ